MKKFLGKSLFAVCLLLAFASFGYSQEITIKGKVTDLSGQILPGVGVVVKGTSTGATTNLDGEYSIQAMNESVLVFSFLGMRTTEVRVEKRQVIDVVMEDDKERLEEVVVVGYGTQKKGLLTGAVSSMEAKKLTAAPVSNVTNMLVGQLPGVIAKQTSGAPGSDGASLNIRGFGAPLIIVDGIESSMSNVDPYQIESVSVLKDGSASIYGARAGNGVVLITTKKGSVSKPKIFLNTSMTMQGNTKINKPQSSGQRAELHREMYINEGKPVDQAPYTEEQIRKFYKGIDPHYMNSDWFGATLRDFAPQQNHNIGISGGTDRVKVYGFLGYTKQETIIKNNGGGYERYNLQTNFEAKILDNLKLTVDVNAVAENRLFSYLGIGTGDGLWSALYQSDPRLPVTLPGDKYLSYGGIGYGNVVAGASTELNGYQRHRYRQQKYSGTLQYDVKQVPGLNFRAFVNLNISENKYKEMRRQLEFYRYNYDTGEYIFERKGQDPTSVSESYNHDNIFTRQYSVNYNHVFADTHRVKAMAAFERIAYESDNFFGKRNGFMTTAIEQLVAGDPSTSFANGGASEMGRESWIGRIDYAYKDKYLIETIFRADASAKFAESKRWGYFPSVSLGWVISREGFMKNADYLDNLKIRASYGESGNDAVGNFQYLSGYSFDGQYILGDTTYQGIYINGIANPSLTWETMQILNLGIDFGFLGSAIYGNADVFYRLRSGIPGRRVSSLPSSFGAELPLENLNAINTRGFELLLGSRMSFGDFSYDISGNITWARSKYDQFDEPEYTDPDQIRMNQKQGKWIDRQFGYVSDGLFQSQEQIDNLSYIYEDLGGNSSLRPGDVIYKDLNEDGVLNWRDQQIIGKGSSPHWIYGLNTSFKYKNLDLQLLFQGAFGYSTLVHMSSLVTETDLAFRNRWRAETNDSHALVPRVGGSSTNGYYSDYYLHNTSYIRLKNASLGYDLPAKVLKAINIEKCRIYVAGTNLFTLSSLGKYGVDPEAPDTNNASGVPVNIVHYYPQQRTFSLGLNLTF